MKEKILYTFWAILFVLCAGLGFIPAPEGLTSAMLTVLSVFFFVPGLLLLLDAHKTKNKNALMRVRFIALGSLVLTMCLLIAIFMSVTAPAAVGNYLQIILGIFSTPMFCAQYWFVSLFLWALLLSGSFYKKK